jgi:hypothetical protein
MLANVIGPTFIGQAIQTLKMRHTLSWNVSNYQSTLGNNLQKQRPQTGDTLTVGRLLLPPPL